MLSSRTELCILWLIPMPVRPARQEGIQPSLGVTDTTKPSSSADWIEVVPADRSNSIGRLPEAMPIGSIVRFSSLMGG